jgi:hypothetical protein
VYADEHVRCPLNRAANVPGECVLQVDKEGVGVCIGQVSELPCAIFNVLNGWLSFPVQYLAF